MENFPEHCAKVCCEIFDKQAHQLRALDLVCAVGRAAFELTRAFKEVVAIDFSDRFINLPVLLNDGTGII